MPIANKSSKVSVLLKLLFLFYSLVNCIEPHLQSALTDRSQWGKNILGSEKITELEYKEETKQLVLNKFS